MTAPAYTAQELLVTTAAAELRDGESVFVGYGIPGLASHLAKRTHAPNLELVYESGIVDAGSDGPVPPGVEDPELLSGAGQVVSMIDVFGARLQGGTVDVGFLGGAQVDRRGNLNSTVVGEYHDPDARLPGSGGACDIACNAGRTVLIVPHELRRFPESVDFVTSPGYLDESGDRSALGLQGGGPAGIITDKAVLRFDDDGAAYVASLHPGVTRASVAESTDWNVRFADDLDRTPPPSNEELRLLREELDPDEIFQ